jgi:transcriptional regulator with XRE-family HTH domain
MKTNRRKSGIKQLIGERVVVLRKARGWSQELLAFESGVARSYLSSVERGKCNISLTKIEQLATALGVEPWEVLNFPLPADEQAPCLEIFENEG